MNFQRFTALLAAAMFTIVNVPAVQAAPSPKKISITQADKKIEAAIEKTNRWLQSNPFLFSEIIINGEERTVNSYTVDGADSFRTSNAVGPVEINIGLKSYTPFHPILLLPFEVEIANELGLDLTSKWAISRPSTFNGDPDRKYFLDEVRSLSEANLAMFGPIYPKRSTVTSIVKGKSETVNVSNKAFSDPQWGTVPSSYYTFTTYAGRLTSLMLKSGGVTTTLSWKPFTGLLIPPPGPHFDMLKIDNHPEFSSRYLAYIGQSALDFILREALTFASLADRTTPNLEDWAEVASRNTGFISKILYDRGIEFALYDNKDEKVLMCGEFTADGVTLRSLSCEVLGFLKL